MMRQQGSEKPRALNNQCSVADTTRPADFTLQIKRFQAIVRAAQRTGAQPSSEEQRKLAALIRTIVHTLQNES
jgi:hypothetical protein